jgi:dolichol-phosphate mannosyltransferase
VRPDVEERDERVLLSLILPTYNERENIEALVDRLERALGGISHEMIFVDDSADGTDAIIARQAMRYPHIVLLHRQERQGLASAVVEGIQRARGEILCVLDADLQHPPEAIPTLLEALTRTGADLVVASRYIPGGSYRAFTSMRRLASRMATLLARALLSRARIVSDPLSGFFVFRRHVVQDILLRPLGYKILLEILGRGRLGRVAEVAYRFEARGAGQSKLTMRQNWEYLRHLLRLATAQPDDLRFLRFCVVGGSGVVVNLTLLWALTEAGIYYLTSGIAGIAAGTTWNFLLNDAFTWRDRRSRSLRRKAWRYLQYWAVTGVGSALQIALLFLLTTAGLPYLLSSLAGIGAAVAWNFRINGRWTWRSSRPPITRTVYDRIPGAVEVAGSGGAAAR